MSSGRAERAIALLSGGLDSTIALALSRKTFGIDAVLFFDYGQDAGDREKAATRDIARYYAASLEVVELPWLSRISSSTLVRRAEGAGNGGSEEAERKVPGPPAVWVENRNGIFLNIAAAFALSRGCKVIIAGFNREEAADFPDNSAEYVEAVNRALKIGEVRDIRVESPTLGMDKAEIARAGLSLDVPWKYIWSCYRGGRVMCGRCESCARLRSALAANQAEEKVVFEGDQYE